MVAVRAACHINKAVTRLTESIGEMFDFIGGLVAQFSLDPITSPQRRIRTGVRLVLKLTGEVPKIFHYIVCQDRLAYFTKG